MKKKRNKEKLKETNRDFRFTFCKGGTQYSNQPGLYKVKIRVNAKSANSPDITEYFESYIYSYIDKTSPDSDSVVYNVLWVDDPLQYRKILSDPGIVIKEK